MTGIATRQDTGQPFANVSIRLRELGEDELLKANGRTATATTSAQGRFTINIAPGKYELDGSAFNIPGADLKIFQYAETVTVTANRYTDINAVFVPYDVPTAK